MLTCVCTVWITRLITNVSRYHHFSGAPWGFGNDGLLDLRLAASRTTGAKIEYIKSATNARSPFVPLGVNLCGADASTPQASGGWCSPTSGIEANISFDTSAMYVCTCLHDVHMSALSARAYVLLPLLVVWICVSRVQ